MEHYREVNLNDIVPGFECEIVDDWAIYKSLSKGLNDMLVFGWKPEFPVPLQYKNFKFTEENIEIWKLNINLVKERMRIKIC